MKRVLIISLLLCGLRAVAQTDYIAYDDVRNPAEVKNLSLPSDEKTTGKFCSHIREFSALEALYLTASEKENETINVTQLSVALSQLPALHTLRADVYALGELPREIISLPQITQLDINLLRGEDRYLGIKENNLNSGQLRTNNFDVKRADGSVLHVACTSHGEPVTESDKQIVAGMLRETPAETTASNSGFAKKYEIVKPPIPGVDVPRINYTTLNNTAVTLSYPSGTKVYIPENAFVDANGNPVTGPVDVQYREFRNPLDFIVSGIPMTYDSGGTVNHFQSAGMFELTASVNGQEVFLAKDKKLSLDFVATDSSSTYSFYQLNDTKGDQKGGWQNIGSANSQVPQDGPSNAWRLYAPPRQASWRPDTTSLADRYRDTAYYNKYKRNGRDEYFRYRWRRKKQAESFIALYRRPAAGKAYTMFTFPPDAYKLFPELAAYSGQTFVMQGKFKYAEWDKLYGDKAGLNDIRVTANGSEVTIELKGLGQYKTLTATMGYVNEKGELIESKATTCSRMNAHYQKHLAKHELRFSNAQRKEFKSFLKQFGDRAVDSADAWKRVLRFMNKREQAMTFGEWNGYVDSLRKANNVANTDGWAAVSAPPEMIRRLEVGGMGIFNCDQIQRLGPGAVNVYADYVDSTGKSLTPYASYVVDKKINGILTYANYNSRTANYIAFNPGDPTTIIAVQNDGVVALVTQQAIKKNKAYKNEEQYRFEVEIIEPGTTSYADLRKRMAMK